MKPRQAIKVPEYHGGTSVQICNQTTTQMQADFACSLMEKLGSVAAMPDGEDGAKRQKLRLQTPLELVQRCCEISEAAFIEFEQRGWLLDIPLPTPRKFKDEP